MLQDWILQIRQNSRYYSIDTWKYRISGNVIEFSVIQKFTHDREVYRCSVITIGQILKNLTCRIEKMGSHFLIQSFPNLESPEVIASIRMEELSENILNPFPLLSEQNIYGSEEEKLISLAANYKFTLSTLNRPIAEALNKRYKLSSANKWFVLTSNHDNPFIWLKLGSWKESILKNCNSELNIKSPLIFDYCINNRPEDLYMRVPDSEILQALLTIKI